MSNYNKHIVNLPTQQINFKADRQSFSIEDRTVTLVASDETFVERFSWDTWEPYELSLSHDPDHIDLGRVKNGVCMLFDGHPGGFFSNSTRIGKVLSAKVDNKRLICEVKLNRSKEADRYLQDVEDNTDPGNSVGIQLKKLELLSKAKYEDSGDDERSRKKLKQMARYRATSWSIHELSIVDVPAIPSAKRLSKEEKEKFDAIPKYPVEVFGDASVFETAGYDPSEITESLENEKDEEMTTNKDTENAKISQLADENRELKLQLSALEKQNKTSKEELGKVTLSLEYYKLRLHGLQLFAVDNKITQEEFNIDFSEDPAIDLEKLNSVDADEAKLELRMMDRTLRRYAIKEPLQRLATQSNPQKDMAILGNNRIAAKAADTSGTIELSEEQKQDQEAEEFMNSYKPRKIG